MKRWMTACLAALLVGSVVAQDPAPAGGEAKVAYNKLVADLAAAEAGFQAAFEKLQASDAWKAAAEKKDRRKMRKLYDELEAVDVADFLVRAFDHAEAFQGDDAAAFYSWIVVSAKEAGDIEEAAGKLSKHLASERLIKVAETGHALWRGLGQEEGCEWLGKLAAANKHPMIRAWAFYWKNYPVMNPRDGEPDADALAAAQKEMAIAEKLAAGTSLGDMIAAPRFEKERLQIGMAVPDIEGKDTDGVAFKLSDYRGKVVLLDFWGFW